VGSYVLDRKAYILKHFICIERGAGWLSSIPIWWGKWKGDGSTQNWVGI